MDDKINKNEIYLAVFITIIYISLTTIFSSPSVQPPNTSQENVIVDKSSYHFEVVFENLTEKQIEQSRNILSQLEEDYTSDLKRIVFTKNLPECPRCYGLNYRSRGLIYTNWDYEENDVRVSVCHELLHFYFEIDEAKDYSTPDHRIIQDLARKGVCYG